MMNWFARVGIVVVVAAGCGDSSSKTSPPVGAAAIVPPKKMAGPTISVARFDIEAARWGDQGGVVATGFMRSGQIGRGDTLELLGETKQMVTVTEILAEQTSVVGTGPTPVELLLVGGSPTKITPVDIVSGDVLATAGAFTPVSEFTAAVEAAGAVPLKVGDRVQLTIGASTANPITATLATSAADGLRFTLDRPRVLEVGAPITISHTAAGTRATITALN